MAIIKHVLSFGSGELSPMLDGRTDIAKYAGGCKVLENFIPVPQGGLLKRPGLQRLGEITQEDTDLATTFGQIVEFQITTHSSVILALGGRRMKFVDKGRMVKTSSAPNAPEFKITIPWADVDLRLLRWKQVNAVMWFVHPLYAPHILTRSSPTSWTLQEIDFGTDAPLLDENPRRGRKITTSFKTDDAATPWAVDDRYKFGDVVTRGGGRYLCAIPSTLAPTVFSDGPDHWYVEPRSSYWYKIGDGTSNSYGIGTLVWYQNQIYVCNNVDGPPGMPGTVAGWQTGWQPLAGTQIIGEWQDRTGSTIDYEAGDRVSHAGKVWVTQKDHIPNNSNKPGEGSTFEDKDGVPRKLWVESYSDSSAEEGQRVTLTANWNGFRAGHVGSTWEIAARRGDTKYDISLEASEETNNGYSPSILVVQGSWYLTTFGTWHGDFTLEISTDKGETWTREQVFRSRQKKPRNASAEGHEEKRVLMRLRFSNWNAGGTPTEALGNYPYALLTTKESRIRGLVKITEYVSPKVMRGRCISPVEKTTTGVWSEGAWSTYQGFPRCLEMHQNRLLMAGTTRRPHTIWGSAVDDYQNFNRGTDADMSYVHTLAIGTRDPILWMHSDKRLVVGNGAGEFSLRGENDESPVTPEFGVCDRHSSFGTHSGGAGHIVSDTVSLFVQNGGRALREMAYSFQSDKYESGNLNLLAEHLFKNAVQDVAIQRQPFQIVWVVAGGQLFSLTYERTQEVIAWARHPVGGEVIAIGTVRRYAEDMVYLLVRRETGSLPKDARLCIERLTPGGLLEPKNDGSWMDSHTTIVPAGGSYSMGNHPLRGRTVVGYHKGEMIGPKVLNAQFFNGLTGPVNVGLPYSAIVQPMTQELALANGSSRTRECRIHSIVPNVYRARGGKFGETPKGPLDPLGIGSSAVLHDGEVERSFDGRHDVRGNFCVVSDEPFPFTLRSVAIKLNYHGDAG